MLTSFIQSTHHRTADVSAHSLWRIDLDIRKARSTQELLSGILRTFSGEESSCCVFQDDEDCEKKRSSFRDERHRPSTFCVAGCYVSCEYLQRLTWQRMKSLDYVRGVRILRHFAPLSIRIQRRMFARYLNELD